MKPKQEKRVSYKLQPLAQMPDTLRMKKAWRVLMPEGQFLLYHGHGGDWYSSMSEYRHPNQMSAILDGIIAFFRQRPDSLIYAKCRSAPVTLRIRL